MRDKVTRIFFSFGKKEQKLSNQLILWIYILIYEYSSFFFCLIHSFIHSTCTCWLFVLDIIIIYHINSLIPSLSLYSENFIQSQPYFIFSALLEIYIQFLWLKLSHCCRNRKKNTKAIIIVVFVVVVVNVERTIIIFYHIELAVNSQNLNENFFFFALSSFFLHHHQLSN